MKGILLCGGAGTRLYPATRAISKHLLNIYDKPMVYYPLSVLMQAGARDVLIISTPHDIAAYRLLLGSGERIGMRFSYAVQEEPRGIAEALLIGERFAHGERIALMLGDNFFYGDLAPALQALARRDDAGVLAIPVQNPRAFGVVELDERGDPVSIEEKPASPKSAYAIPGLYFYPQGVADIARAVVPGSRGELEITSVNQAYLAQQRLHVQKLGHGVAWLDTGTHDALLEAAQFVATLQRRLGIHIACIETVAYRMGFIAFEALEGLAREYEASAYGDYLRAFVALHGE